MAFNNVLYIVDVVVVGFVNDIVVIFYFFFFATDVGAAYNAIVDIDGGGCVVALFKKSRMLRYASLRAATRLQHTFTHSLSHSLSVYLAIRCRLMFYARY